MNVTVDMVKQLKEAYKSNKEDLKKLEQFIELHGVTDDGLTDETESFEQGYNNAMEFMFDKLGIKYALTVEELKLETNYEFACEMSEEYKDYNCHDEWGCAEVWLGDIGVEYNFCIDGSADVVVNCCAIYKMEMNKETDYMETDYDTFAHYEIDFNNPNWKVELENAMCRALIKFHNL